MGGTTWALVATTLAAATLAPATACFQKLPPLRSQTCHPNAVGQHHQDLPPKARECYTRGTPSWRSRAVTTNTPAFRTRPFRCNHPGLLSSFKARSRHQKDPYLHKRPAQLPKVRAPRRHSATADRRARERGRAQHRAGRESRCAARCCQARAAQEGHLRSLVVAIN